jgi:hypothetical protein
LIGILPDISRRATVPDPTESEEQADRYNNLDLDTLADIELRRELAFVRWLNHVIDSPWHQNREQLIAQTIRQRHERRGGRA